MTQKLTTVVFFLLLSASSVLAAAMPSATPSPMDSPSVSGTVTKKEARSIRRSFVALLDDERDKLRAEQKLNRKNGEALRKARRKEWDAREKTARRKFFLENTHGPERRQYVHEFNDRRRAFYEELKNEERQQKTENDASWKAQKEDQKFRMNAVEGYLKRLERPPSHLLERAK